jgi:hypothetical protein
MASKLKVVDKFGAIKAMLNGEKVENFSLADAVAFIDERIAITEKKNASGNGERKPTATQIANEGIKEQILEALANAEKPMTNGEITKAIGSDQPNKVCQLVAQMLTERKGVKNPEGKVVRTEVKGKAYFALAEQE